MNQKSKISDHKKKVLTSNDLILLCLAGMGALFLLIFAYFPMFGLILAFKYGDYALNLGRCSEISAPFSTIRPFWILL